MFKAVGTQEARNETGVMVEVDGYAVRYHEDGHVLEFGAQPGLPSSEKWDALLNVYFPVRLEWKAPHQHEPVTTEKSRQVENYLEEALHALDCEVIFTLPVEA